MRKERFFLADVASKYDCTDGKGECFVIVYLIQATKKDLFDNLLCCIPPLFLGMILVFREKKVKFLFFALFSLLVFFWGQINVSALCSCNQV